MYKKCSIVMLFTQDSAPIIYIGDWKALVESDGITPESSDESFQHLYLLSDEEIKEGDWVINSNTNNIAQYTGHGSMEWWKKIIATTDSSLVVGELSAKLYGNRLPDIPQSFINSYIQEYNKGNIITEVEVEYDEEWLRDWEKENAKHQGTWYDERVQKLKINPDNTVNIKQTKQCWTREEVEEFARIAFCKGLYIKGFDPNVAAN